LPLYHYHAFMAILSCSLDAILIVSSYHNGLL
jgi:hypothetical protein